MKKLVSVFILLVAFLIAPGDVMAQKSKSKPKAKTDPSLTISKKKTKKVKNKIMKRKSRASRSQVSALPVYWRREMA